jgi:hypothetical protein
MRIILALQDQITVQEQELESLDREYSRKEAEDVDNERLRNDMDERSELLDQLSHLLQRYSKDTEAQAKPSSITFTDR